MSIEVLRHRFPLLGSEEVVDLKARRRLPSYDGAYEEALLVRSVQDAIIDYLTETKLTRRDLAQAMDVSEGRVSQILSGRSNLTLATLAAVAHALGARYEIELIDRSKSKADSEFAMDDEAPRLQLSADAATRPSAGAFVPPSNG